MSSAQSNFSTVLDNIESSMLSCHTHTLTHTSVSASSNASSQDHNNEPTPSTLSITALMAWDDYIQALLRELFDAKYQSEQTQDLARVMKAGMEKEMAGYVVFDSQAISSLFRHYFAFDITQHWELDDDTPAHLVSQMLDSYQVTRLPREQRLASKICPSYGFAHSGLTMITFLISLSRAIDILLDRVEQKNGLII
ncbi:hypothetical protein A9264_01570 [Vibrio sp. UCD-FRSSP16_10]|uniref:hypothetical protein n=1 Tax=unclassified Vibrio TaxID=2614977 RepID=UPI0007FB766C|nr:MULTISPECIES: hypothetical protein [unclassified Vibrio]OBT13856.1 hypothetical protein A9260_03020 [Vibrio sp. UCD-FRSSP16_30]OBT22737.1 hypothetical protein A9264_01570 [Vibrio sp. UCD-FRSSP16_10]